MTRLVAACRAHGIAIIHTVLCGAKPDRSDVSRQMRVSELPLPVGDPRHEIRPEVAPKDGEQVFPRTTYGIFADRGIAEALRASRLDTLLIGGMLANIRFGRPRARRPIGISA